MAVPKKRTGHAAQGSRRANWKATKPETTKCPNCGATVLTHTVCTECGTYKGQPVKLADKAAAAAVAEKPAKKTLFCVNSNRRTCFTGRTICIKNIATIK